MDGAFVLSNIMQLNAIEHSIDSPSARTAPDRTNANETNLTGRGHTPDERASGRRSSFVHGATSSVGQGIL
jgi:hypothetical protein